MRAGVCECRVGGRGEVGTCETVCNRRRLTGQEHTATHSSSFLLLYLQLYLDDRNTVFKSPLGINSISINFGVANVQTPRSLTTFVVPAERAFMILISCAKSCAASAPCLPYCTHTHYTSNNGIG